MPPLLWAVYILCFLCTVIVSVSAVALAKIDNLATEAMATDVVISTTEDTMQSKHKSESNVTDGPKGPDEPLEPDDARRPMQRDSSEVEQKDVEKTEENTSSRTVFPGENSNPQARRERQFHA
jgi:hypothetical protein